MRRFVRWAITAAAGLASTAAVATAYPIKLIPGYYGAARQPDGNTVIFEDAKGLIVVDTGRHLDHQAKILDYAKARGKPITAIVNTHWHLDHSGGNQELRAVYPKAALYASTAVTGALGGFLAKSLVRAKAAYADPKTSAADKAEIKLGLDAMEDRKDLIPDHPVTGPMQIALGRGHLDLRLAGHAATEGDVWLYDPSTRTAVVGDLVVLPAPFFDTACADGWRRSLDDIDKVPFTTVIPGHGPRMSRAEFETYRTAFDRLVDCAHSDKAKSVCIAGWTTDAAPLLVEAEARPQANELLDYYFDNILRSPAKTKEFCG